MPRTYRKVLGGRQINTCDPQKLSEAVEAYKSGRLSLRSAAETYAVKKSTLYDHVKSKSTKRQGGQPVLDEETEKLFVKRLIVCAEWGNPLTAFDLRIICKAFLDRKGVTVKKFPRNMPGEDWAKSFLKRHSAALSERLLQNIKVSRASVGPDTITSYFSNLKREIDGGPLSNIINYDETNLTDDPGKKKVIVKRGSKYPENVANSSKSSTSLMLSGAADGTLLPFYTVFKAKHLYDTWTEGGPSSCRFNRSASGWFDSVCFEDWFFSVVVPHMRRLDGKKVLIGDNLSSHLSVEVINKCIDLNIAFILLPPNSTHLTQPLDVAFFRPMKGHWRKIIGNWKTTVEGRREASIPKATFPKLLKKLADAIQPNQEENLKSGFKKCGIAPYNPDAVLGRLPNLTDSTGNEDQQDTSDIVNSSFMDVLKEMRGLDAPAARKRSKRLKVPPGKSVAHHSDDAQHSKNSHNGAPEENDDDNHLSQVPGSSDVISPLSYALSPNPVPDDHNTPSVSDPPVPRNASCQSHSTGPHQAPGTSNNLAGPSSASAPNTEPKPIKRNKRKVIRDETSSEESEVEMILDDDSDVDFKEDMSLSGDDVLSVEEICAQLGMKN